MYDKNLFDANVQVDGANLRKDSISSIEFQPSYKKSPDHVFKATIRFIPYIKNVVESVVSKYTVWLENPLTHEKRELDDPSTVNEPSIFTQTFFDLRNSSDPVLKENSKGWSRKMRYASIIQILDCPSDPTLVNQLRIWRYGEKIYALISDQMTPSNPMVAAASPFSLMNGRYLYLKVQEKSGFNNFDACAFYDSTDDRTKAQCPVMTANGIQYVPVNEANIANQKFAEQVKKWLNEGPSLEPYKYHPMTDDDRNFAITCANISKNPKASMQAAASQFGMGPGVNYGQQPAANPSSIMNMNSGQPINPAPQPQQQPPQPQFGQPVGPAPQPQMPSINEAPGFGDQPYGPVPPAQQPPSGFSGNGLDNLNDVLGSLGESPEPQPQPQAEAGGGLGNLDDIISGII